MSENAPFLADAAGREFTLRDSTTVGRAPDSYIFVGDPRASRRHAELRWDGATCVLRDLDSANGTFVNGARIASPRTLYDGDRITVASAEFTFHDPQATYRAAGLPLLVVDAASGELWVDRRPVTLSPKEQILFDLLYRNAGRVVGKQEIAQAVWPEYQAEVYDYQIESLVKQLRERLEPDPRHPVLVVTLRGRGYKLTTGGHGSGDVG